MDVPKEKSHHKTQKHFCRIVIHSNCQLPPVSLVPVLIMCLKKTSSIEIVMIKRKML